MGVLLWLLPASSPAGAIPFLPLCTADPPPATAWGAVWFPDDSRFALASGRELLARQDFPGAACYLRSVEEAYSNDPQFRTELGDADWGAGFREQALAEWEKALALDPGLDDVLNRLWKGYFEEKEWDQAEEAIGRRLARQADDADAEYALALIRAARDPGSALELLGDLKSAPDPIPEKVQALAAVIRAAVARRVPEYIFARTGEELLSLGEPGLAEEALRRAIERNPNYGEAFALLGLAREAAGEDPEEAYRRAVSLTPNSAFACMVYGSWLRREGESALARWWLMQAWTAKPGDWIIASELSQADFALGNTADAETWVVRAVEAHPSEAEAWIALAAFYIENDYQVEESGIPAARQAVLLAPTSDRALDIFGLGWYKLGDFSTAERLFLRALAQNPDSASGHLHLGLCYFEQGRSADAKAEWTAAYELDSNGSVGQRAKELLGSL